MKDFNEVVKICGLNTRQSLYVRLGILKERGIELDPVKKEKYGRTYKRMFSDSDIEKLKNMPINKGGRGRKTICRET
jgi:hypothetical protein